MHRDIDSNDVRAEAERMAGGDERLADNWEFSLLFDRKTGHQKWISRRQWIETFFTIKDKQGSLRPLIENAPQRRLERAIIAMQRAGIPVRIRILKSRKMGFCLAPTTRVLTSDLRWVELRDVAIGDRLMACDENIGGGKGSARRLRVGSVLRKTEIEADAYEITTDDGRSIVATKEHRLLSRRRGGDENRWTTVGDMRIGDSLRRIASPWHDGGHEDGWFGGMIDGEGHLRGGHRPGASLCLTQNDGPVLRAMADYLERNRYHWHLQERRPLPHEKRVAQQLVMHRLDEIFEIVGRTRPVRYINDTSWWEGKNFPGKRIGGGWCKIMSIRPMGRQPMMDLSTSTGTYIAEGIVSHNSTLVQAIMFERVLRGQNMHGLIVADKDDRAEMLLTIANLARRKMPKRHDGTTWDFRMDSRATYRLQWGDPINGSVEITSAQTEGAGRGGSPDMLHLSETAFWKNAEKQAVGILESLPDTPNTMAFDESTANGDSGWFRNEFWKGWEQRGVPLLKRSSTWVSIFFAWFEDDGYRWTRTFGAGRELPPDSVMQIHRTLDDEEEWLLQQKYFVRGQGWKTVDYDQLLWRRMKIEATPGGVNVFNQEYPSRPEIAFMATGSKVFDPEIIQRKLRSAKQPLWRGTIEEPYATVGSWGTNETGYDDQIVNP